MLFVNQLVGFGAVVESLVYTKWDSATKAGQVTLSGGDLTALHGTFGASSGVRSVASKTGGLIYWEETVVSTDANDHRVGICNSSYTPGGTIASNTANGWQVKLASGDKVNNSSSSSYGSAFSNSDVVMHALNLTSGKYWVGKNGTWFNSGDPAGGTNEAFSGISGTIYACDNNGTSASTFQMTANFGASPFTYTPPAGFSGFAA